MVNILENCFIIKKYIQYLHTSCFFRTELSNFCTWDGVVQVVQVEQRRADQRLGHNGVEVSVAFSRYSYKVVHPVDS